MLVKGGTKSDRSTFFKEIPNTPIHTIRKSSIEKKLIIDITILTRLHHTKYVLIKTSIKKAQKTNIINTFWEIQVMLYDTSDIQVLNSVSIRIY